MSKHELPSLPAKTKLDKMSSEELTSLSAELTGAKDEYLKDYRSKQEKLNALIAAKIEEERQARIDADPDYWKKHQGIGGI